jgi:hypothetical protein
LEQEGISTAGQRAYHLLQRAGLEGLLCLGPKQGREPTYRRLSVKADSSSNKELQLAQMALAERYIISHGPARIQDLCWWSGLPLSVGRQALQNTSSLQSINTGGQELWIGRDQSEAIQALDPTIALLLPPFDEYLLGYRDRGAVIDPTLIKRVNAGGGMLKPTIIVDGKVVGAWKQIRKRDRILISIEPFRELTAGEYRSLVRATDRYGCFYNTEAELLR